MVYRRASGHRAAEGRDVVRRDVLRGQGDLRCTVEVRLPPGFVFPSVHSLRVGLVAEGGDLFAGVEEVDETVPVLIQIVGEGFTAAVICAHITLVPAVHGAEVTVAVGLGVIGVDVVRPDAAAQALIVRPACFHGAVAVKARVNKFGQLFMELSVVVAVNEAHLAGHRSVRAPLNDQLLAAVVIYVIDGKCVFFRLLCAAIVQLGVVREDAVQVNVPQRGAVCLVHQ